MALQAGGADEAEFVHAGEARRLFVTQAQAFLDQVEGQPSRLCSLEEAVSTLRFNLSALASAESGARSRSQHSQPGLSSSIVRTSTWIAFRIPAHPRAVAVCSAPLVEAVQAMSMRVHEAKGGEGVSSPADTPGAAGQRRVGMGRPANG